MKNLLKLGLLLVISGLMSSCGAPMAAMRTVQNTASAAMSVAGY